MPEVTYYGGPLNCRRIQCEGEPAPTVQAGAGRYVYDGQAHTYSYTLGGTSDPAEVERVRPEVDAEAEHVRPDTEQEAQTQTRPKRKRTTRK